MNFLCLEIIYLLTTLKAIVHGSNARLNRIGFKWQQTDSVLHDQPGQPVRKEDEVVSRCFSVTQHGMNKLKFNGM
jgi:hypothetical protein